MKLIIIFGLSLLMLGCVNSKNDNSVSGESKSQEIMNSVKSGYAQVNGISMYYEIYGEGEIPLVLIHGGGSTIGTTFGNILPLLAKNHRIIAMELQAHGHSGDREGPETFEQDADDVFALLQHLKVGKADLFGFSNGGNTAMQVAIRHPEVVNKLIIASAFYKREGMMPGFFDFMKTASLENMPEQLKTAYLEVAPDKDHLQVMHDKDRDRMINFKDWKDDDLKSITMPTLILSADKDVMSPEHATVMHRLITNSQLVILPGVHGAYIGESITAKKGSKIPELTIGVIEEFLAEEWLQKKI
ncbi:MAG: alpha/beta hydrolase [Cyclobacteriaceae bacterium]|nr:alpha/beta hydrolase [Cyclobacteriaceae bacterium]